MNGPLALAGNLESGREIGAGVFRLVLVFAKPCRLA